MKKVLAICLMVLLVMSLSVNVFATSDEFVASPSGTPAPTVVSFEPSDEDCTAKIVITPHAEKDELPETLQTLMDKAYKEISEASDLTELNEALAKLVEEMGVAGEDLAVSDLFDIHVTDCDFHDGHVDFDIVLDADMLKNFVGLLHMNKDGEWELVEDAKVVNNGEHLQFSVETLSPFAIVVDAGEDAPKDNCCWHWIIIAILIIVIVALILCLAKRKKKD